MVLIKESTAINFNLTNDVNINRDMYMEQVNVANSSREELLIAAGVTAGIWVTNLIDIFFFKEYMVYCRKYNKE